MPGNPEQCRLNAARCLKLAKRARRAECASHLLLWQTRGQDWRLNTNPMKHFSARFLSWNSASLMKLCRWL